MDPVTGLVAGKAIQAVSSVTQELLRSSEQSSSSDFETEMRNFLQGNGAQNEVNEEELFAALLRQRIGDTFGEEAQKAFTQEFKSQKRANRRSDGYVNVEAAAENALDSLVGQGLISQADRGTLYNEAFAAAQLDNNKNKLYDGTGSANDPTIAVSEISAALLSAQAILSGQSVESDAGADTDSGSTPTDSSSGTGEDISISSEDGVVDGPDGFLWKPESEHEKKVVVLLPPDLAQLVDEVTLLDEDGNEVEKGRSTGYANAGADGQPREHIRFNKAGSEYPQNLTVEVRLTDGSTQSYLIPNPAARND